MVKTLTEDLSDSILVHIFQLLPFYDRLNLERVCRRWRKLAVWESWTNFKIFSYKQFLLDPENKLHYPERFSKVVYEFQKRQISYEEFETLFSRCGKWLEELSLEKFQMYEGVCFTIFPLLPALRHLHMAELVESEGLLQKLAGWLPELRSVVFYNMHYQLTNSLTIFLSQASKLEYLEIKGCIMGQLFNNGILYNKSGSAMKFPTNLRYLSIDKTVESAELLAKLGEQCKRLESLSYSAHVINLDNVFARRLRYLQIKLDYQQKEQFVDCLNSLSNLQALDLYVVDHRGAFFANNTLQVVVDKCCKLEHLSITGEDLSHSALKYSNLLALAQLENLTSLEIKACDKYDCREVLELFQAVYEKGKLEHFETDAILLAEHICKALSICKNFRHLAVPTLDTYAYSAICKTMMSVQEECQLKTARNRILQVRLPSYEVYCDFIPNPWVKIEKETGLRFNTVKDRIRLGKLDSVASYMKQEIL